MPGHIPVCPAPSRAVLYDCVRLRARISGLAVDVIGLENKTTIRKPSFSPVQKWKTNRGMPFSPAISNRLGQRNRQTDPSPEEQGQNSCYRLPGGINSKYTL